jgi:antitoxin ParD1/3/4
MKHADPNSLVITLPADQMERLDEAVQSGGYASKTDVVLEALRLWEERHATETEQILAWHRYEHEQGLASGLAEDLSPEERLSRMKADFALNG